MKDQAAKVVTGEAEPTVFQAAEGYSVGILGLLGVLILVEGVVIGASGFLPEAADQWVADVLYPSFSPTVLVFLAGSTLYGLVKARFG